MTKNEVMVHKLCEDIAAYNDFVFYGAGYIAKSLIHILDDEGYKPLYCVVTDLEHSPRNLEGISVYGLDEKELELQKNNTLVVVATTTSYEAEIKKILSDHKITEIRLSTHYFWIRLNESVFWNVCQKKDFDWYASRMEEWALEQGNEKWSFSALQNTKRNKNRILFVVNNFSPRVVKIAKALKKSGKEVIIFLDAKMKNPEWIKFYEALQEEGIRNCFYKYIEELLYLLLRERGFVIHIFSHGWDPYTSYILVKFQDFIGRIVFENYDIINGFYTNFSEENMKLEKYCMEQSRGICYRESGLEYLIDTLHFKMQGKTIRFWDYCSESDVINKKSKDSDELSICYSGGVITEEEYSDCPLGGFFKIAENCEKHKCHLHIYPSVWDENKYRKYIEKDHEDRYFHFHRTLPYDKLIREIAQYDYGFIPASDDIWDKEYSGYNTKYKYIYASTNKFFDYLDAGLPVIAAAPLQMAQFFEKKGVLINWTIGQYDFDYLKNMRGSMSENVAKTKKEMQIGNQINRLIDFYESL